MSFNARSLRNKINELKCILYTEELDIVAISETFLDFNNTDFMHEYVIDKYKLYYKDRVGQRGGGVCLYVKNHLNPAEVTLLNNNSELICVRLSTQGKKINLVVAYRRPSQTAQEDTELYNTLQNTLNADETVILGDYNLPYISWELNTGEDANSRRMIEFMEDNFLHQFVREPTRGNNILDLVIATHENLVSNLSVGEHLSTCDHKIIRFEFKIKHKIFKSNTKVPNYKNVDLNGLRNDIKNITLCVEGIFDVNKLWIKFKELFMIAQNKYIPMQTRQDKGRSKPLWFNNDISRAIRERNRLHKLKKNNNSIIVNELYTNARRQVKRLIKSSKRQYEINIAKESTSNPKSFYRYINGNKQIRTGIGPLVEGEGELITDDKDIADALNKYFSSVLTNEETGDMTDNNTQLNQVEIQDFSINSTEVLNKLNNMNINKSPGPDMFYPRILKIVKDEVAEALTLIFNKSLDQGVVPDDWKIANITPIFKKGDRKLASNHRPISLTSVVGKSLESIIRDKLVAHLESNNLIRNSQHGFRSKRSCLTNLVEFYDNLLKIHDCTKSLDIIYLDFQKAFDKVPHGKLMKKVKELGITGNTHKWIVNWLKDRKQRVVINGIESEWAPVGSGVPQGSVLGPILFTIYINDIDVGLNNLVSKFADDTKIGNAILTEEERINMQLDLNKITEWSEKWKMPFNVDKCQVLHVGSKNKKFKYEMKGKELRSTSQVKDLGVIITESLKPSIQCTTSANKANRALGFIKINFTYKSKDIIIPLYKSIVRPHLEYAVQFWSPYLVKDINKLESVQRRATKLVPSLRGKSYQERLKELNLFSLKKRRLRGQLIECFKTLKGFNNVDATKVFSLATDNNNTRGNGMKLTGRRVNLDVTKNFFTLNIVDEWNSLPRNVVDSTTINTFKNRLDQHLEANGVL